MKFFRVQCFDLSALKMFAKCILLQEFIDVISIESKIHSNRSIFDRIWILNRMPYVSYKQRQFNIDPHNFIINFH